MSLTPSAMIAIGTPAPDFKLADVTTGKIISLDNFKNKKALLVMFICNHCPYVQHVKEELASIGEDYQNKDLGIVAISANDADEYPEDSPENLRRMARELNNAFPYCYDETQETAKAYSAACTPDFFLFDKGKKLVYRGQLDDSRPGNGIPVTGRDLRSAIDAVIGESPVSPDQKPSTGCNIKWKS
jgi:thiol-disulfide isomerase/thioredoxin